MQDFVAYQSLLHYFKARTFGGEWLRFAPDSFDVAKQFPKLEPLPKKTEYRDAFRPAWLYLKKEALQFDNDELWERFLVAISDLDQDGADPFFRFAGFYLAASAQVDIALTIHHLDSNAFRCNLPYGFSEIFELNAFEAMALLTSYGDQQALANFEIDPKILKNRDFWQRILRHDPSAYEFAQENDFARAIWPSALLVVAASNEDQDLEDWLRARDASGQLNGKDLRQFLNSRPRSARKLTTSETDIILKLLAKLVDFRNLLFALQFANNTHDLSFGKSLFNFMKTHEWARTSQTISEAAFFCVQFNLDENLRDLIESTNSYSLLDLHSVDKLLEDSFAEDLLEAVKFRILANCSQFDFPLVLRTFLDNNTPIKGRRFEELSLSLSKFVSSDLKPRLSSFRRKREILETLTEFSLVYRDNFSKMSDLRQIVDLDVDEILLLPIINSNGEISDGGDYKSADLHIGILSGFFAYLVSQPQNAKTKDLILWILEKIDFNAQSLSGKSYQQAFKALVGGDDSNVQKLLERLFSLQGTKRNSNAIQSLVVELARDRNPYATVLRELASNAGIPLSTSTRAIVSNLEIESGLVEARPSLVGPSPESWRSLAVILDDVVHELAQPLGALSGFLKTGAKLASDQKLTQDQIDVVWPKMLESVSILSSRLLDYQSLTSRGLEFGWYDIKTLLIELVELTFRDANTSGIEVKFTDSHLRASRYIWCEPFMFRLAIRNLLKNAEQAVLRTDKLHKSIRINVHNLPKDDSRVVISVEDTGAGVPEEMREQIFLRGVTTKEGRGLGLGLALAASVVSQMDGRLDLNSTGPAGSEFRIILPSSSRQDIEVQVLDEFELAGEDQGAFHILSDEGEE